jgi:hypothetical protein
VLQKGSNTVYTPQVMIGEQTRMTWSWPDRADTYIKQTNNELALATLGDRFSESPLHSASAFRKSGPG